MPKPPTEKKRQGYFLLFFSLIILMLSIPVWVRTVERDILVRQDITRWQQYYEQRNILNFALPRILAIKAEQFGLGYYKFQEPISLPQAVIGGREGLGFSARYSTEEYQDYQVQYSLVGASVVPIPTATFTAGVSRSTRQSELIQNLNRGESSTVCEDALELGHNVYENCSFLYDPQNHQMIIGQESRQRNKDIQFFYTLPIVGTGNAHNDNCQQFSLNLMDWYEDELGEQKYVDPLDHPCNWNRLEVGKSQVVTVPLFVRDQDGNPIYHDPELFSLRLRFPCVNGQRFCDPIHRPILKVDAIQGSIDWDTALEFDITPRLIDYAFVIKDPSIESELDRWTFYRPLDLYSSGRRLANQNYELSHFRSRFRPEFGTRNEVRDYGFLFNHNPIDRVTNFNLINLHNNADPENRILPRNINFLNLNTAETGFQLKNAADDSDQIYSPTLLQETKKELYLTFRVDGFLLTSEPILTRHSGDLKYSLNLRNIEYQIISDKPFGSNRMFILGAVRHPQAGWQTSRTLFSRESEKFDVPNSTGVVFTN